MWYMGLLFYFLMNLLNYKSLHKIMFHSNLQIAAVGGFFLLIGFLGFICGSQYLFGFHYRGPSIEVFYTNPFVSSFIAAFTSLLINRYFGSKWSLFVAINGALTGMVSCAIAGQNWLKYYKSLNKSNIYIKDVII